MPTYKEALARRLEPWMAKEMKFRKKFPAPRMEEYLEAAPELAPANPEEIKHTQDLVSHLSREECFALARRLEPHLEQDLEALVACRDFPKRDRRVFRLQNGPSALTRTMLILSLSASSGVFGIGSMLEYLLDLAQDAKILKLPKPFVAMPDAVIGPPSDPYQHCFLCLERIVPEEGDVDSVAHDTDAFLENHNQANEEGEEYKEEDDADVYANMRGTSLQTCCGHIFCLECFSWWVEESDRCPECRGLL